MLKNASENINTYKQDRAADKTSMTKKIEITPIYLYLGKGGLQTL